MKFPISNWSRPYFRKSKATAMIIYSERKVCNRVPYLQLDMDDDIKRTPRPLFVSSEEYLKVIRSMLPINRIYCPMEVAIVDVLYCFNHCRFAHKFHCKIYMKGLWGCFACGKSFYKTCNQVETCKNRKMVSALMQFYFVQELSYSLEVWFRFRYGKSFRANYLNQGPQIYFCVGHLPIKSLSKRKWKTATIWKGKKRKRRRKRGNGW